MSGVSTNEQQQETKTSNATPNTTKHDFKQSRNQMSSASLLSNKINLNTQPISVNATKIQEANLNNTQASFSLPLMSQNSNLIANSQHTNQTSVNSTNNTSNSTNSTAQTTTANTTNTNNVGNNSSRDNANYSGYLMKWTNYIKGYQKRWFVLNNGLLSYYR
jgi:hypothetical protein